MGDPAGVGPEIIVGAWSSKRVQQWCRPFVVGHPDVLRAAARLLGGRMEVVEIDSPDEAEPTQSLIPCLRSGTDLALEVSPGEISARAGQAAYDAIVLATDLALSGRVEGIVTAPLCKQSLQLAGLKYPGHTELLADLCSASEAATMGYLPPDKDSLSPYGLGVVHVTFHIALRDVPGSLTVPRILSKARLADSILTKLRADGTRPHIGVCALNPHAGEGGLFGQEEREVIRPAVEMGLEEGLDLVGPLPTDTLMVAARDGRFDGVVAMYHDQGHIALRLMGFHRAVNITAGLPIVRTSVAHGIAFDIAWQGRAQPTSMIEALRVAGLLSSPSPQPVRDALSPADIA